MSFLDKIGINWNIENVKRRFQCLLTALITAMYYIVNNTLLLLFVIVSLK
jgi:hypothetical protein